MQADPFQNSPRQNSFNNGSNRQQSSYNNGQAPASDHATEQPNNPLHRARPHSQVNGYAQNDIQAQQGTAMGLTNNQQYQEQVPQNDSENERDYTMFPVYSKRAALQFKLSETRKSQGRNFSFDTIMIEGAVRINPNDHSDKRYDWSKKLSVQIMLTELPVVIAVFLGITTSCQFMNHGQNKDKGFNFERQEDGLFASVFHKGGSMAVKMDWPTTLNIGHFMLAQYTSNFAGLGSDIILRNINRMCQDMIACSKFPVKAQQRQQ
ncbi:hypothetical protein [Pseudoalteromonas sp. MelDa3]|uniref:hypothetical protein n=1 Tax=Pseudoalteromonas sp. MelDa3 TaxID=888435 RepID=UPI000CC40FE8|nr:hypothetical protein [Pseudoalteromonas sp. MelDa3]PLT26015.1 hypothetical protein CXF89_07385 [Pseudoalteromonas sp. MelDa3]